MEEINNFHQEPDETLYQAWEHFKELLMKCPQHYLTETVADAKKVIQEMAKYSQKWHNGTSRGRSTETSDGLATIQAQLNNIGREIKKVNEKVYAAQVGCGGYRATTPGFYQRNTINPSYQERRQSMEDTLSKFIGESTKRHEENSNVIKEIQASTDAAIRNQGASIKTLEIQIRQMSKVLQERGFGSLPSSTETNPRDQVKSISTTMEADSHLIRQEEGNYGPKFAEAYGASHINNIISRKEKDQGRASISVMPLLTYLNLGLGELAHTRLTVELVDRTMKYPKGIAKNVLVGIGKFTFLVDFIILDMPEDIKVPLIHGRTFLSTARAKIDVYKRKITLRVGEERIVFSSVKPASSLIKRVYMLSLRERIELDLEARLMGETLVRNQGDNLMPTIKEGEVIEEFRTRDDELDTKIDDYPRALMNVPIFVGTFSVVTDFVVLEDMDAYCDEGMGDVIVSEPFLREVGIKARRFDGMITIYNGDDEVTYQMVRSHPRFKCHTNEQCNKILPLLKVSEKDEKNGISHAYQKLKGFYKGVLNLGPNYIRNAKMEKWLTHGHISVHEME
ncbi:mitochondrial proton/calcium exchanger protein-like protein isoform X1 [Tanacetum coccineum]